LTVPGAYTQTAGGSLDVRVGGLAAGTQLDQLNVQGAASLGGTVNASLVNGFIPAAFQTFPVVEVLSHDDSNPKNLPASLGSSLNATNLTLFGKVTTSTTLASDANPSVYGQAVTFTATVSAADPGGDPPSGTVQFKDGDLVLNTETLSGGAASFTTAALAVAGHSITALYSGDNNFTGSASPVLTQTVNQDATTTTLSSSVNPSIFGQTVTFTATVSASAPGGGAPSGLVTFCDGGALLGTASLQWGNGVAQATLTTSLLGAGTHAITAVYSGDANFLPGSGSTPLAVLEPASLSGVVFADINSNGRMDGIDWGDRRRHRFPHRVDDLGHAVSRTQKTGGDGRYLFANLRPGNYTISETQPADYGQGIDSVGTAGGSLVATDQFFVPLAAGVAGCNYNFGEQPTLDAVLDHFFGSRFAQTRTGQNLILLLNGGACTQADAWLAATLANVFGSSAGARNLDGRSNADIAALLQMDLQQPGRKPDAQGSVSVLPVSTSATRRTRADAVFSDFDGGHGG
jgi:hypothetical protein